MPFASRPNHVDADLVWRAIEQANPWWVTGVVPRTRARQFRRHAQSTVLKVLKNAEPGRGVVVLGPRRVGKTVLLHQIAEDLLATGDDPRAVLLLSLDDVALRGADIGDVLDVLALRAPATGQRTKYLLLDEVQHSPDWSGWLKRIADRRDPYVFLATGSSATALIRGGQDAGLGRWREMQLLPWSFREHVGLRGWRTWTFDRYDEIDLAERDGRQSRLELRFPRPDAEDATLEEYLLDYLARGGFPEVAETEDVVEAQRHLRQDILDRALGRDVLDSVGVDSPALERMFLRITHSPGGLWNQSNVGNDLAISRPTVQKYLSILERAFLVFSLPNLASPIKGLPKVYLVAPSLRAALFNLTARDVREPNEWGRLVENLVATSVWSARPDARQLGFWREDRSECDFVVLGGTASFVEVKRGGGKTAGYGIRRAAAGLRSPGVGWIVVRSGAIARVPPTGGEGEVEVFSVCAAEWLYAHRGADGGTLRASPGHVP